nr:uncharacterized protein LOC118680562 [Bactrocera oleae]
MLLYIHYLNCLTYLQVTDVDMEVSAATGRSPSSDSGLGMTVSDMKNRPAQQLPYRPMSAGPVLHRSSHYYHHPASYPHPHPPPHHHSSLRHLGGSAAAVQREREREARCLAAAAAANTKTIGANTPSKLPAQQQNQKQQHPQHASSSSSSLATNNQSIYKTYATGDNNNKTDNQHQVKHKFEMNN